MNRFNEDNDTVRWLPGFVRRWFGLTDETPQRREAAGPGWMPGWLQRFFGLTYEEPVRYTDEGTPSVSSRTTYTPPPRSYTPGTPSFTPTPRGFAPASYRPTSGEGTPSTPTQRSLAGDELPTDIQPIGYLLRSYARGALPPQGLEAFTREVRTTTEKVFNFYGHWLRFQTEELFRIGGDLCNAVINALPGEPAKPQNQTIRRIKVVADNGNGNSNATATAQTSSAETTTEPERSEDKE